MIVPYPCYLSSRIRTFFVLYPAHRNNTLLCRIVSLHKPFRNSDLRATTAWPVGPPLPHSSANPHYLPQQPLQLP